MQRGKFGWWLIQGFAIIVLPIICIAMAAVMLLAEAVSWMRASLLLVADAADARNHDAFEWRVYRHGE
jgi:hypothetical protein